MWARYWSPENFIQSHTWPAQSATRDRDAWNKQSLLHHKPIPQQKSKKEKNVTFFIFPPTRVKLTILQSMLRREAD